MKYTINQKILLSFILIFLGSLSSFSLPPYNYLLVNFLTFPSLIFILIINKNNSKIFQFILGWSFGFGYFISNLYWISNSLTHEDIFNFLIPFAIVLIPFFLAIFYGLVSTIFSYFNLENNIKSILIFSLIFSVIEFIRGHILSGFPWNLIVYSWSNYITFIQSLSLVGTYSLNLISITIFCLPVILLSNKSNKFKVMTIISLILILFLNHFYGTLRIQKLKKVPEKELNFNVKVISPKINLQRFFKEKNSNEIIKEIINLSNPKKINKTVYIFPEGILPAIKFHDLRTFREIFKEKFKLNIPHGWRGGQLPFLVFLFIDMTEAVHLLDHIIRDTWETLTSFHKLYITL